MKKRNKIIIGVVLLIAVLLLIYPMINKTKKGKIEYITAPITIGTISKEVTASGTLNPLLTVDVGTQVSGILSKIFVDFNSKVTAGQVLAMIDTTTLYSSLIETQANLYKAQAMLIQAKNEYLRYKELLNKKTVSQSEYEQVYANYQSADNTVKASLATLQRAKTNLKYATITAPIDGIVISKNVNVGQTVAASFQTPTLFSIANDLSKMQLQARIDEADIGQIKTGQNVIFTVDAYPNDEFYGIVSQIRLQPVTMQNVVTYTVIIDAPNADLKLLPGMNSNISIIVQENKDVMIIPLSALNYSLTKDSTINKYTNKTLWLLDNGKPKAVTVTRGIDDGSYAEINGTNIKEGMKIIIGEKEANKKEIKSILPTPPRGKNQRQGPPDH